LVGGLRIFKVNEHDKDQGQAFPESYLQLQPFGKIRVGVAILFARTLTIGPAGGAGT